MAQALRLADKTQFWNQFDNFRTRLLKNQDHHLHVIQYQKNCNAHCGFDGMKH